MEKNFEKGIIKEFFYNHCINDYLINHIDSNALEEVTSIEELLSLIENTIMTMKGNIYDDIMFECDKK